MSDATVYVPDLSDGRAIDNTTFVRGGTSVYRQRVETYPYLQAIARGQIAGAGVFRVVGRNPDVDNVREDLWENGGTYVPPPAGGIQMQLVSTSADDAAAGIGARTIDIHYLDANGDQQVEVVTMNGLTPVLTVATDIWRINEFHTKTAGSTGYVAGTLEAQSVGGAITYAQIEPSGNRARQAFWTIPAGKIGFIKEVFIGGNAEGGATSNFVEGYLRATCDITGLELLPGIFNFKGGAIAANSTITQVFDPPIPLPALCDIKISVQSRASNSNVRCVGGFSGWYEDAA